MSQVTRALFEAADTTFLLPDHQAGLLQAVRAEALARSRVGGRPTIDIATELGEVDTPDVFAQAARQCDGLLWMDGCARRLAGNAAFQNRGGAPRMMPRARPAGVADAGDTV